ncbi:MAG: ComF family protein [Bacteroidota bacterium]
MSNPFAMTILGDFVELFFPRYCLACQDSLVKGEEWICTRCQLEMPRSNYHLERENPFYNKFRGRIPLRYVMALFKFVKESRVQHLLHALKYNNKPEVGRMLGNVYGQDLLQGNYKNEFDLIIPVPLHRSRKKRRGYNQSDEFGKGIAEILKIPCFDSFIERTLKTETQTRKSKLDRWQNVNEVFSAVKPREIENKRILLIDDVVTTGATIEACGQVLLNAGCAELSIACIAATQ